MEKGLVSVIMPVYKVEAFVKKSIESIQNQTYTQWELLVVDDGSPDNSASIVREMMATDSRIQLFQKSNGGLSDARNFGMERARGEFLYFIDSDDWAEPDLLKKTVSALGEANVDLVVFGYFLDTTNGQNALQNRKSVFHPYQLFEKKLENLSINENLMGILGYAWNKVYRHQFILDHQLRFEKGVSLVEDILFNAQVYKHAETILVLPDCLYHYLNRPISTLIKTYHEGAFSLYLKKNQALESFLGEWKVAERNRNVILSLSLISGLRYSIRNLIAFMDGFSDEEKIKRIAELTNHSKVKKLIRYYPPAHIQDWVYATLVRFRFNKFLYYLLNLR